ncbi:MAG: hypothetical protein A2687_02105 [Candidatus Levybacteria bacterium RIFCSPHIGHO2_01_FULL_38_26]|nr:MAG: hypothetical protein A2687_02105 [Candidatus Levybacteria bacterium RIFCSPHIGHO2_01_FULL_38_26]
MKIGVIAPIWLEIPPKGYGGTEYVVYNLVNGLVDKGHDVTFFGARNAKVKAKVFPTVEMPLREQSVEWTNVSYTLFHLAQSFEKAGEFDVIHMHVNKSQDYLSLPLSLLSKTPVVFTLHFKVPTPTYNKDRYLVLNKYRDLPFTSISNSQRKPTQLNYIKTVYNSLDIKSYPFSETHSDYFVWLGKINPLKGTKEAILAAKRAGVKLYVMGVVDRGVPHLLQYYEKEISPLIDGKNIIWIGEVETDRKAKYLAGAKAFLNPILWEEPFGLVMAESQATGTPVISFNRGAAPEVIVDGKTGFLVDTLDQMVEKMKYVDQLNRRDCRDNVESKFSIEKMVEGYEDAYSTAMKNWKTYINTYLSSSK